MPKQEPQVRADKFNEVTLGYAEEEALKEAKRCIQCKNPGCIKDCPVEVGIPGFIRATSEGNMPEAVRTIARLFGTYSVSTLILMMKYAH